MKKDIILVQRPAVAYEYPGNAGEKKRDENSRCVIVSLQITRPINWRIKVKFPWLSNEDESNGKGSFPDGRER